jgi:hypothetical protein
LSWLSLMTYVIWSKVSWSNVLAESQLLTSLNTSPNLASIPQMMVTLLVLMFQPIDVIIMCLLNDIRAIDFWPNEEVSVKGCELGKG